MKPEYYDALINGVMKNNFPPVPVDYGYRDSTNFWYTQFPRGLKKPIAEPIPAPKETDLESIRYAANRCDIEWLRGLGPRKRCDPHHR